MLTWLWDLLFNRHVWSEKEYLGRVRNTWQGELYYSSDIYLQSCKTCGKIKKTKIDFK